MIVGKRHLGAAAGIIIGLHLAACAGTTSTVRWVKTGTDEDALASERGINQDINATLGRNWQMGGTLGIEDQAMSQQTEGFADRILNNCMRAKGFTKAS